MQRFSNVIALACFLFIPAVGIAEDLPGKILFESVSLGNNGKSCATCHEGGKGLEKIGAFDSPTLQGIINICIEDALKGAPFREGSRELKELEIYLRQLTN